MSVLRKCYEVPFKARTMANACCGNLSASTGALKDDPNSSVYATKCHPVNRYNYISDVSLNMYYLEQPD